jgi:hypothetical protein
MLAFDDRNTLAFLGESRCQRWAGLAGADDDGVKLYGHRLSSIDIGEGLRSIGMPLQGVALLR